MSTEGEPVRLVERQDGRYREWNVSLDHGAVLQVRLHDAWDAAMLAWDGPWWDDSSEQALTAGRLRSLAHALTQAADMLEGRSGA